MLPRKEEKKLNEAVSIIFSQWSQMKALHLESTDGKVMDWNPKAEVWLMCHFPPLPQMKHPPFGDNWSPRLIRVTPLPHTGSFVFEWYRVTNFFKKIYTSSAVFFFLEWTSSCFSTDFHSKTHHRDRPAELSERKDPTLKNFIIAHNLCKAVPCCKRILKTARV